MPREPSPRTLRRRALYGAPVPGSGADHEQFPPVDAWPDAQQVRFGTSGWAYSHWRGRFYPRDLPPAEHLPFYAARIPTVEVNSTYYRLPTPHVVDAWRETVPPGFLFTLKAPGSITHEKRLVDVDDELKEFLQLALRLRESLGVVLFQLPPGFHADLRRLGAFLETLPRGLRYAFELRHRSWFERDVYMLLADHAVSFVVHDFGRKGTPIVETAPFVYLRLHGPSGRYRGSYDVETLLTWSEQVREWKARGFEVFGYFNNDERGKGIANLARLRDYSSADGIPKGVGGAPTTRTPTGP